MMVPFAYICDSCKVRGEEFGHMPQCRETVSAECHTDCCVNCATGGSYRDEANTVVCKPCWAARNRVKVTREKVWYSDCPQTVDGYPATPYAYLTALWKGWNPLGYARTMYVELGTPDNVLAVAA